MEAKLVVVGLQGGVELVRSVEPAPIDDPHDLFAGAAEGGHHLVDRLGATPGHQRRQQVVQDAGLC